MIRHRALQGLPAGGRVILRSCEIVATEVFKGKIAGVSCTVHPDSGRVAMAVSPFVFDQKEPEGTAWSAGGFPRCALFERTWLSRRLARHLEAVAGDPECPAQLMVRVFRRLAASPEPSVRLAAARSASCPSEVRALLGRDVWWEVRAGVASGGGCPSGVAADLARDPNVWVRRALAENVRASHKALGILAVDGDLGVRDAVAEHPRCPPSLLMVLSGDDVWEVRRSVARRRDAPAAVLAHLSRDPEHWVRFFVAANPATPEEILEMLARDLRPSVREIARRSKDRVG